MPSTEPFYTLSIDEILDNAYNLGITKVALDPLKNEPFTPPNTLNECHAMITALRANLDNVKKQNRAMRQDWDNLFKEYKELEKILANCIDMEETYALIVKYCKHNKLDWKPSKSANIVKHFISMLEYKLVPIDDDLVD